MRRGTDNWRGKEPPSPQAQARLDGLLAERKLSLEDALERYGYRLNHDVHGEPFLDKELTSLLLNVMLNPVRHNRDMRAMAQDNIEEAECLEWIASWSDEELRRRVTLMLEREIESDHKERRQQAERDARRAIAIRIQRERRGTSAAIRWNPDNEERLTDEDKLDCEYMEIESEELSDEDDKTVGRAVAEVRPKSLTVEWVDRVVAEYKVKYATALDRAKEHREVAVRHLARIDEMEVDISTAS
jgi:hypothetical protein